MNCKATAGLVAGLLLGSAGIAWSVEPDGSVTPPPGVLPTLPENAGVTPGRVNMPPPAPLPGASVQAQPAPPVGALEQGPSAPPVTPSSTIFVSNPGCTPCGTAACDVFFPNL